GKSKAQSTGARNQPILPALRLGNIAPVHKGLKDAIDAGFRDMGLLVHVLERQGRMMLLQKLDHVERLGKNRNQIQSLDLRLGQPFISAWSGMLKKPGPMISDQSHKNIRRNYLPQKPVFPAPG